MHRDACQHRVSWMGGAYCLLRVGLVAEIDLGVLEYIRMGFGVLVLSGCGRCVWVLDRTDHCEITVSIWCDGGSGTERRIVALELIP
jgi:hypothetical protein